MTVQISWLPRPAGRRPGRPEGPRSHAEGEDHDLSHQPGDLQGRSERGAAPGGRGVLRQSGAANPAVKSYVVGPELGGEFEYGAVYVVEDLDGYWAYLEFPAHVREELWGIPYLEKFAAIDVSDSEDPELGAKVAALQARHQQEHPEIAALIAQAASFTVPDGAGQPSAAG